MMYGEAIEHVHAGRAVFSKTYGATLVHMPKDKVIMAVPRVANVGPVRKIEPFSTCGVSFGAVDWELSGVVLPPAGAGA
jgi:hypothetical protein